MKKFILLVTTVLLSTALYAGQRDKATMKSLARAAVNANRFGINRVSATEEPKAIYETDVYTMYKFDNGAFAIVTTSDLMPEVVAYGDNAGDIDKNLSLRWWLTALESKGQEIMLSGKPALSVPTPDPNIYEPYVEPLVNSRWDQEEPYWRYCPMDTYGRALTGCVATAISQVLYTNKYPQSGIGEKSLTFNGQTVYANYEETTYRYDLMQDRYTESYTDESADAVATLMMHAGVAVNMMYGADGSGAYSQDVEPGLRNYFGIESARFHERDYCTDEDWMDMLYSELSGGHPLYYDGVSGSGWGAAGHAFVCDGYDENGRVHMNWGWSGHGDGYFDINLLNTQGYQFEYEQGMCTGMYDPDDIRTFKHLINDTVTVDIPGTLRNLVESKSDTILYNLKALKINGAINDDDIAFIRDLASGTSLAKYGKDEECGILSSIDMRNAVLEDGILPAKAFKDAAVLRRINMPKNLVAMGDSALAGCTSLVTIYNYAYNVPSMGKGVFNGIKSKNVKGFFIAGSSEAYSRNAKWKEILNGAAIEEFGTCVKARNYNRKVGEANPGFGYQIFGKKIEGTPEITCEADENSPEGRYPITIAPGTIEYTEDSNIVFIDGYLNIFPAEVDGIESVKNDKIFNVYTVDGVQVRNNATSISDLTPDIYIINGKKVIIK